MAKKELTAITIFGGIITLLEEDGTIGRYRQRGIDKLSRKTIDGLIWEGKLSPNWREFKELPKNYNIHFEDEWVMGKANANFKI